MNYVALLRGINVGGKNKIEMKFLRKLFEDNKFTSVRTYINSGNVLFSDLSKKSIINIKVEIQNLIKKKFKLEIEVIILSKSKFNKIANSIPHNWTNDKENKTDILFLDSTINNENIIEKLPVRESIDNVLYVDGAIIWNIDRKNISKTGLIKVIGTELYKKITIRNSNTVRKISSM